MAKLAMFLDGTRNNLENNTNVWRLRSLCDPAAPDQHVYYSKGVGTTFGEIVRGSALGYGIEEEIIDAYTWLAQRFSQGDDIFIFGFSRGAYTARSLSGLIAKCGVLAPGAPLSIQQLFARYRRADAPTIAKLARGPAPADLEERWILKYCVPSTIRMIGVWDTVGALGNPLTPLRKRVARYRFLDTHLRRQNEHAFQALAIDDHRMQFEPTPWTRTVPIGLPDAQVPARPFAQVEQRWFVGAHANVGGGYASDLLAQPPLEWLMAKASSLGLVLRSGYTSDAQSPTAPIADSYSTFLGGLEPVLTRRMFRPIGPEPKVDQGSITERINESLDGTVFDRWRGNAEYRPPNLVDWARRSNVDPAVLIGARSARNPDTPLI